MSFLQIILIANIIVLCAYLIHLWDICPYREKTNQNVLIKAIIDTSKANVAITKLTMPKFTSQILLLFSKVLHILEKLLL
ncbi:hypothetical protein PN653_05725, partial [Parabacteroides distasonis]|uniref:hypothetical protein n=1 Tax=Parabacteroides distasonis TaxID=823 RepID=UPI0023308601